MKDLNIALSATAFSLIMFIFAWYYGSIAVMVFTQDYIKDQLRPNVNDKTAYVIYKYGLPKSYKHSEVK